MSIDPLFFESILLKFILTDSDIRDKVFPFLDEHIFDGFENREIFKLLNKFLNKFKDFPTIKELKPQPSKRLFLKKYLKLLI
ncbi:MAG: hypothetical protein ACOC2U_02500 [bacterium]